MNDLGYPTIKDETNTSRPRWDLSIDIKPLEHSLTRQQKKQLLSEFSLLLESITIVSLRLEPNTAFMDTESDAVSDEL